MTFDIAKVPFSRAGSYMAISRHGQASDHAAGVVIRTVHGDAPRTSVFLVELLDGDKPVAFTVTAGPAMLKLESKAGNARFCFATPKCIRFLAHGVKLRLTLCLDPGTHAFALPMDEGRWQVKSFVHRSNFGLTPLRGQLHVDAPWNKVHSERVVAEFVSGPKGAGTVEGVIEEYISVLPPWRERQNFEDAVRDVQREFEQFYRASPSVSESMESAGELAAYVNWSAIVAPEGHFRRPAMLMSKNWMAQVWSWDHCFNAMALSHRNPDLAWDQLQLPFDHQDASGALPDCYNDRTFTRTFVKPPIHGWALRYMMQSGSAVTPRRLKEFYEPLAAWTNWWLMHCDSDRDGVPQYLHGNDSGWDNSTAFDVGVPLEGPDLCSFLTIQMDVLADVATKIGKKRDARRWTKLADRMLEQLLAHSWRGDAFVAPRNGDHQIAEGGDSLVLFMPLILGQRLPPDIRQKLVAGIASEGRFLTKHGLATENVKSAKYESDGYWRGPIWAPSTHLIVDGLMQCGEKELAREIATRFCNTVAANGMAENFDALTGKPLRDPAYTWTSSSFQVLAHDIVKPVARTGRYGTE